MTTSTVEIRTTFRIADEKLAGLQEKLGKLAKRAEKLGVEAPVLVVGEKEIERIKTKNLNVVFEIGKKNHPLWTPEQIRSLTEIETGEIRVWWACEITGAAPKLNGWKLLATLQNFEGEIIIRAVPGCQVPPQYRDTDPTNCDHCKTARKRNDTFIVQHDDGRTAQVGRQCLRDFLGHTSPELLGMWAEMLFGMLAAASEAEEGGGSSRSKYFDLQTFMEHVVVSVRVHGWVPRSQREFSFPTADDAMRCMFPSPIDKHLNPSPTVEDIAKAKAAIEYADMLVVDETTNDFIHNIHTVARVGMVEYRTAGIAAAIMRAFDKNIELAQKQKLFKPTAERGYVGTVGKREVFEFVLSGEPTVIDGGQFISYLHRFSCDGNVVCWFASNKFNVEIGVPVMVKATVTKQEMYQPRREGGVSSPQTMVNRVALYCEKTKPVKAKKGGPDVQFEG